MTNSVSLKSIFEDNKEKLSQELNELMLPKDAEKVQKVVADYLCNLFENENVYRQNLTESEDYILQSAIRLLQAQQNITLEIAKSANDILMEKKQNGTVKRNASKPYYAIAGAGVGALAGGFLGTWVAVAGAIAGAAVGAYCTSKSQVSDFSAIEKANNSEHTINTNVFIGIVGNICENIDGVIETYRVQIRRVENIYNQREEPSLQNEYSILLSQIANVYNTAKTLNEPIPEKLSAAIDFLAESLGNYGLKIENGKIINA